MGRGLPGETGAGGARRKAHPSDFLPPSFPGHLWLNLGPTLSAWARLGAPGPWRGRVGEKRGHDATRSPRVERVKDPPSSRHPPHGSPNPKRGGRMHELAAERESWGGGALGWERGDRGPALPRARPRWEDAHRVRGPAGAQPRRLPSLSITRGPAASAQPSPPSLPPPPPASCPRRPGVEAAQRPPEPGRGGGPGRGGPLGLRPAAASRPAQPPPRPHSPAQPPGGTRRKRVASPADRQKLRGVVDCLGRPDFASSRRGAAAAAASAEPSGLPPSCLARSAGGERRRGGRGRHRNSKLCEGIRSR